MKKNYIAPKVDIVKLTIVTLLNTGSIATVGINKEETITSSESFGSRRSNAFWDDEEYDEY